MQMRMSCMKIMANLARTFLATSLNSSWKTPNQHRNVMGWTKIFKKKDPKPEVNVDPSPQEQEEEKFQTATRGLTDFTVGNLKKRTSIQTQRAYKPPSDVEEKVNSIVRTFYYDQKTWGDVNLNDDRRKKFRMLTKLTKTLDHVIPNTELHEMKTIHQVVEFFKTEVKDTTTLEDLSKLDLPPNLNINTEYIRYDRETDPFRPGKDAYPGQQTKQYSVKYSRKYHIVDKSDDRFKYKFDKKGIFD